MDRVIIRLTDTDEGHLTAILDTLRLRANCYQERYPTRTRAVREALAIAAAHLAASASVPAPL